MSSLRESLGKNLEQARHSLGYSRERLSEFVDLDPITIRNYEKGYRWPQPEDIEALAKALGVDPHSLYSAPPAKPAPTDIVQAVADAMGVAITVERPKLMVSIPKAVPALPAIPEHIMKGLAEMTDFTAVEAVIEGYRMAQARKAARQKKREEDAG